MLAGHGSLREQQIYSVPPQQDGEAMEETANMTIQEEPSTLSKITHFSYWLIIMILLWDIKIMNQEVDKLKNWLENAQKTQKDTSIEQLNKKLQKSVENINKYQNNITRSIRNSLVKSTFIQEMTFEQHYLKRLEKTRECSKTQKFLMYEEKGRQSWLQSMNNFKLVHHNIHLKKEIDGYLREEYQRLSKEHDFSLPQLPFCVVVPTINNEQNFRYAYNLYSIFNQNYTNFKVAIMDDGSQDRNFELISQWFEQHPVSQKVILHKNPKRMTALPNIHKAAHQFCDIDDIIVLVDGDDELLGVNVFKVINSIYTKKKLDVLYSNLILNERYEYVDKGWSSAYTEQEKQNNVYRDSSSTKMFPVRTFKTTTFRKIQQSEMKDNDGKWFQSAADQCLMPQLLEYSCGRNDYVDEYFYLYNYGIGNNDMEVDPLLNERVSKEIRFNRAKHVCEEGE